MMSQIRNLALLRAGWWSWLLCCAACGAVSSSAVAATAAETPNLNGGVWQVVNAPDRLLTSDGKVPPLLPAAQALYAQRQASAKAGDRAFDITLQCKPPGMPRIYLLPGQFEFLQRPEQVAIFYEWNRLMRLVDMDVPQPEPIGPTYMGQSVGHWQGRTLIIDSISFIGSTMLDNTGLPHSADMTVREEYAVSKDGQTINATFVITDPANYQQPWTTTLRFKRIPKGKIREDVCPERQQLNWGTLK